MGDCGRGGGGCAGAVKPATGMPAVRMGGELVPTVVVVLETCAERTAWPSPRPCRRISQVPPSEGIAMREALAAVRAPSLVAWRRITAALDAETDPARLDAALSAVDSVCAVYPDRIRLAPGRWIRPLFNGHAEPRLRVCRAVEITLHDVDLPGDRFAWTDAPDLAGVTVLRVCDERIDDSTVERWLGSANNSRITELTLGGGLTDRGACCLASDARLSNLESLALFRNAIGSEGLAALIGSPRLGSALRRLLLGRNQLGETGAKALAGKTTLGNLALLDLDCNRLDGAAIRALVRAPLLSGVRKLNLSNNPVGAEGCAALAACPHFDKLEELLLHDCQLDDEAVALLLRAPFMPQLRNLALSANVLSITTIERIAACHDFHPDELDICHNRFGEAEAEAVLRAAPLSAGLRRLCL